MRIDIELITGRGAGNGRAAGVADQVIALRGERANEVIVRVSGNDGIPHIHRAAGFVFHAAIVGPQSGVARDGGVGNAHRAPVVFNAAVSDGRVAGDGGVGNVQHASSEVVNAAADTTAGRV